MKKVLLFTALACFMLTVNAQKALKFNQGDDITVRTLAAIEESVDLPTYRGDDDESTSMVLQRNDPWTVEAWIKPLDTMNVSYSLFGGGNTQFRLAMFGECGKDICLMPGIGTLGVFETLEADEFFGDTARNSSNKHFFVQDVWQHLAVVNDGWDIILTINGVDEYFLSSYTNEGDLAGYDAPAYTIGDNGANWTFMPSIIIDNYRVWDEPRSIEEIAANMYIDTITSENLIANYTFDNDDGKIMNSAQDARHMTFNESADGLYSYSDDDRPNDPTSIKNLTKTSVSVYPNPAISAINVSGIDDIMGAKAKIYSISGQLINETIMNSNEISIASFSTGLYILKIDSETGIYTAKFSVR